MKVKTIRPQTQALDEVEDIDPDFKPLTASQAQDLRQRWKARGELASLWPVVGLQWLVLMLSVLALWLATGRLDWVQSWAWGGVAVAAPALWFAQALGRARLSSSPMRGLLVAELVKVLATVLLLVLAPRLIPGLVWWALLAGFVLTLKVYVAAGWWVSRRVSVRVN